MKKLKKKILQSLGNVLISPLITLLCKTIRVNYTNKEVVDKLHQENQNYVVAFWHGHMLMGWYLQKRNKISALISPSKDGEILSRLLKYWNYEVIRGSSNEKGKEALEKMKQTVNSGYTLAITPDGPKGPIYKFKAGAVVTAKAANVPVVLMGITYNKYRRLKSWDKFYVPKFFSSVNVKYSDPIYINNSLTYDEVSAIINDCEKRLNQLSSIPTE